MVCSTTQAHVKPRASHNETPAVLNSIVPLQATLEEVVEADILIHVMDGSSAQMLQQRRAVLSILQQLGESQPSFLVYLHPCGVCLQSLVGPAALALVCKDSRTGS